MKKNGNFGESPAYAGLVLAAVTFCCLSLVFAVRGVTAGVIAEAERQKTDDEIGRYLEGVKYDNNPLRTCYLASGFGEGPREVRVATLAGSPVAYVVTYDVSGGYAVPFVMTAGVTAAGNIIYLDVIEFNETPGLGDKILRSSGGFLDSFRGAGLANRVFEVKKDGGDFDYYTGATVTPRAVVRSTASMLRRLGSLELSLLKRCGEERTDGTAKEGK